MAKRLHHSAFANGVHVLPKRLFSFPYPLMIESVAFTVSILALSLSGVILLSAGAGLEELLPQAVTRVTNVASIKKVFFMGRGLQYVFNFDTSTLSSFQFFPTLAICNLYSVQIAKKPLWAPGSFVLRVDKNLRFAGSL